MLRIARLQLGLLLTLLVAAVAARAADERVFHAGTSGKAELRYINDLPVLTVEGTPEEIGRQKAALTTDAIKKIVGYPHGLLKLIGREDRWQKLVAAGTGLLPQCTADHRAELRAFAEGSGIERDLGVVANTLVDIYRGGLGCSSLIVEPSKSATGGPLFGRNLDFYTLGFLQKYNLVTVHRPLGKRAFVSIGFPGFVGCLSGMNDAGLALAVHEVYLTRDGSPMFNPDGMPYAFCFRRILEECETVDEAEKLLRATKRTTLLNLAVCDRHDAAVFEMTPKTVVVRRGKEGILACTNHFRSKDLAVFAWCRRYNTLRKTAELDKVDLAAVAKKLDEVNQGRLTVQTMVFEPEPLVLHLAIGSCPSSALPLKRLELKPLFHP